MEEVNPSPPEFKELDPELVTRTNDDFLSDKINLEEYLAILARPDDTETLNRILEFYRNNPPDDINEFEEIAIKPIFSVRPDLLLHPIFNNITDPHIVKKMFDHKVGEYFKYGSRAIIKGFLTMDVINLINDGGEKEKVYNNDYKLSMIDGIGSNIRDGKLMEYIFKIFDPAILTDMILKTDFIWIYKIKHPETLAFILDKVLKNRKWLDRNVKSYQKFYVMSNICYLDPVCDRVDFFNSPLGIEIVRILLERRFPVIGTRKDIVALYQQYTEQGGTPIDLANYYDILVTVLKYGNLDCIKMVLEYCDDYIEDYLGRAETWFFISHNIEHAAEIFKFWLDKFGMEQMEREFSRLLVAISGKVHMDPFQHLISIANFLNLNISITSELAQSSMRQVQENSFVLYMKYDNLYRHLRWLPHTTSYFRKGFKDRFRTLLLVMNRILPEKRSQWRDIKWILGDYLHFAEYN